MPLTALADIILTEFGHSEHWRVAAGPKTRFLLVAVSRLVYGVVTDR